MQTVGNFSSVSILKVIVTALFITCRTWAAPAVNSAPEIIEQTPGQETGRVTLSNALQSFHNENYSNAIPDLELILERDPRTPKAWEALGWSYFRTGRANETENLWNRLTKIDPDSTTAWNNLGRLYVHLGDFAEAEDCFDKSLELDPDQQETRFNRAKVLRWQGKDREAVQELQNLTDYEFREQEVKVELARSLQNLGRFSQALKNWEQVEKKNPEQKTRMAWARLLSDSPEDARKAAEDLIEQADGSVRAQGMLMMANIHEYGDNKAEAVAWLKKAIIQLDEGPERQQTRIRLLRLYQYLYDQDPFKHPLDEALKLVLEIIDTAAELGELTEYYADMQLTYAELLMLDGQYKASEQEYLAILERFNPDNYRAHRGLFEVYMVMHDYKLAGRHLDAMRAFNPVDPYLNYYEARLESGKERYDRAYKALERLETAGRSGCAAILLYHTLSPSKWSSTLPVSRFREHLFALKEAGFQFVTPAQLSRTMSGSIGYGWRRSSRIPRVVSVTFDDGRRNAVRLGGSVAEQLGITLANHIMTGRTEEEQPLVASWEMLKEEEKKGRWIFGSHLERGQRFCPINPDGLSAPAIVNREWNPETRTLESLGQYMERVDNAYKTSRERLDSNLGARDVPFVAYPYGNIGQYTLSNTDKSIIANLTAAEKYYSLGFIQSTFGYAVNGDNPLMYQRWEPSRRYSGTSVVYRVMTQHPVFLAMRLRAEFAALEGERHLAMKTLDDLEKGGYPKPLLKKTAEYVVDRIAGQFEAPLSADGVRKGPFEIDIKDPYMGVSAEYFEDSINRENYMILAAPGINITPNLIAEGIAGTGQLKQDRVVPTEETRGLPETTIKETDTGARAIFNLPNGWSFSGRMLNRDFDSPAAEDEFTYQVRGLVKPVLGIQLNGAWSHDVEPSAVAVTNGITYDMWSIDGIWDPRDWWDISGNVAAYNYSRSGTREHLGLKSMWRLYKKSGLYAGLGYGYVNSEEEDETYWTPYRLHRYFIDVTLRRSYRRIYYNVRARYGIGKEDNRPEDFEAFEELLARARRENFAALPTPPEEQDWESVLGISASCRLKLGEHWELSGEASYNEVPNYDSTRLAGTVRYRF